MTQQEQKELYPLSGIQKQFYLVDKLAGSTGAYNLLSVIEIDGKLDIKKLNYAFQSLVTRHESLRTGFMVMDSEVYQIVHKDIQVNLLLNHIKEEELEDYIKDFVKPFTLSTPPLIKAVLLEIPLKNKYYFVISIHHIISDDKSMHIMLEDILAFYYEEKLPELKITYKEYSYHQNQLLKQRFFNKHKKFWKKKLANSILTIDLPYDLIPTSTDNYLGKELGFNIDGELFNKIKSLAVQKGSSLYSLLLTVYIILLSKYSQQESIVVGCSMENRQDSNTRNVVGAFVNTLPISGFAKSDKKFTEFWEDIKSDLINTLEYQEYPCINVNQLCKTLHGSFNTLFDFHVERFQTIKKQELTFSIKHFPSRVAKFPISLEAILKKDEVFFVFEYNNSLFQDETISKLRDCFIHLLQIFVTTPDKFIGDVSISPINLFNGCTTNQDKFDLILSDIVSKNLSFLDLFNKQLSISAHSIAASCEAEQISYLELEHKSNQLANYLITNNIEIEDIVGVIIERSIQLLIALIGILKVGAVYLPIDRNAPKARIKDILEVSNCKYLLIKSSKNQLNDGLIGLFENQIILDYEESNYYNNKKLYKSINLLPKNLAYVIFTSGSTGKPKGVMLTHLGMLNHLLAKVNDLNLTSNDIIAQTSSMIFDVSIWQFLSGLVIGSKISIIKDKHSWQPSKLIYSILKNKITVFETVPSHMVLLLNELENFLYNQYKALPLRWLIINGEPLLPNICYQWLHYYSNIKIMNAYGPTECSDDILHYNFDISKKYSGYVPIGKNIKNMFSCILDKDLNSVPKGVSAELYTTGVGLARGYINNPEATASAFLPLSNNLQQQICSSIAGERIYKTGDIVKCINSYIEYIGRKDRQIKILGNRVELGEIESIFQNHNLVKQALVVLNNENTEKHIIVYLTIKIEKNNFSDKEYIAVFREYAANNLPNHMIPKHIIILESFPLLSNGKVDVNSLPKPLKSKITFNFPPKLTKLEKTISQIWQTTLGVKNIDTNTHFLEAGGNSLLALQIILRISEELHFDLSLNDFFNSPTIKGLADLVEKLVPSNIIQNIDNNIPKVIINYADLYKPFPVTEVQQAYLIGRTGLYNMGNVSVHIYSEYESKNLNIKKLESAWNKLIQRHSALRTIFPNYNSQVILDSVPFYKLKTLDFSRINNHELLETKLDEIRHEKSHFIFPLDKWPLFEISLIKLQEVTRIYLSIDVLIMDGWSTDILFKELYYLYNDLNYPLETLELTFRDYVLAIESFKNSTKYNKDKAYWLSRIANFPGAPDIPVISTKNLSSNQKFVRISDKIDQTYWFNIKKFIKNYKLSLTGFIAAIFADILRRFSNSDHFVLNLTVFDRIPIHSQVNKIVGDFTSVLLLEIDYRDIELSKLTLLDRIKYLQKQLWQDLEHSSFSGIEFIRELKNKYHNSDYIIAPIVLTSILGLDDPINNKVSEIFGKEVYSISQTPQVWLDFKAFEINGELIVEWDFVSDIFPPGFINSMHKSYIDTIKLIGDLSFDWKGDKYLNFIRINEPINNDNVPVIKTEYKPIPLLFEEKAYKLADKNAIISPTKNLTYKELSSYVKKFSSLLNSFNLVPNKLIAVMMHKGWEQIVTCLGGLKIRIPYLPIDPELPLLRIKELIEISEVQAIITLDEYIHILDFYQGLIINFEKALNFNEHSLLYQDKSNYDENDLAYVIFTSGSTGIPKGVIIKQAAVLNTLLDINSRFNVGNNDRVLSISSLSFDLSVYDIFGLLIAGGTIVIPDYKRLKDPYHWLELLISNEVTIWNSTPVLMQMLMEVVNQKVEYISLNRINLRLVLLSGDWIPVKLPNLVRTRFDPRKTSLQIIALGGATETSIWSTIYEILPDNLFDKSIPYGFALKNQKLYILSDYLELCPIWVTGELYIGGFGLSNGYWKDQNKTEIQFIIHPRLGRLYRTGDLCRYTDKGFIEILGRKDNQIKIDGMRIEIGEIESALISYPSIVESVIMPFVSESGTKKLAAYIVLTQGESLLNNDLLNYIEITHSYYSNNSKIPASSQKKISISLNYSEIEDIIIKHYQCKSYRQFNNDNKLKKQELITWLSNAFTDNFTYITKNHFINQSTLLQLLQIFLPIYNHSIPKYTYPSAGSLYTIKAYLITPHDIGDINKGVYLINKEFGYLEYKADVSEQFLENNQVLNNQEFYLYFTIDETIMESKYGKAGVFLGILEVGYMLNILEKFCKINGWNVLEKSMIFTSDVIDLQGFFNTKEVLIKSIKIISSTNNEENEFCSSINTLLYVKQEKIEEMEEGWYNFNIKSGLVKIDSLTPPIVSPSIQDTYSIYNDSSLMILFYISNPRSQKELISEIINVGKIAQRLRYNAVEQSIGTCPIGNIFIDNKQTISAIDKYGIFVHCLLAGKINSEQFFSKIPSTYKPEAFQINILNYLREKLPKYMIPQSISILQSLPVSSNGKIDRKLLPKPVINDAKIYLPNNQLEEKLLTIWHDALKIDKKYISTKATFFELGGNSLLLIEIHNKITKEFNIVISIAELFENPTIYDQAIIIDKLSSNTLKDAELNNLRSLIINKNKRKRTNLKKHLYDTK